MLSNFKYYFVSYKWIWKRVNEIKAELKGETDYEKRLKLWDELTYILKVIIYRNRKDSEFMKYTREALGEMIAKEEVKIQTKEL